MPWYGTLPGITHDLLPASSDTVDQVWERDRSGKGPRRKNGRKLEIRVTQRQEQTGQPETPDV